jgi:hypothetical protein
MARGQAELVTTFEVDANGLLKVTAQDRASGRKAQISEGPCIFLRNILLMLARGVRRHHKFRRPSFFC